MCGIGTSELLIIIFLCLTILGPTETNKLIKLIGKVIKLLKKTIKDISGTIGNSEEFNCIKSNIKEIGEDFNKKSK